jgi:RNA polymerase-binding protein DksA
MADSLTPEILQELRSALVRERESLRQSIERLGDSERTLTASQAEETGGQANVATDLVEEEIDIALESAARKKLAEVDAALQRIANGTYGICANCGKPISIDRLRAVPWTTLCLDCSGKAEGILPPS